MRDHSQHIEISRDEAVARTLDMVTFNRRFETVDLDQAFGRVLAHDVVSTVDVPNVLTCMMDSVALHWSSFEGLAEGEVPDTSAWVRGVDWQFANTGIAMPEGFDTAVVIEHVTVSEDEQHITLDASPSAQFAGTKAPGDTIKQGQLLAKAGDILTPDRAAYIATANVSKVAVVAKPKVVFIPTGNELVKPGSAVVPAGRNIETNSILAHGRIEEWGGEYLPWDIVPDSPELIKKAVAEACSMADVVVLNAGSSKGSDDWSVEMLDDMGTIVCHQVNHGPGHHSSMAVVDGTPVVGISGPSMGASLTMGFYIRPMIMAYLGLPVEPPTVPAVLTGELGGGKKFAPKKSYSGEQRPSENPSKGFFGIRPVDVTVDENGVLKATPVGGDRHDPRKRYSNGLCLVPTAYGDEPVAEGSIVNVELR